MEKAAIASLVAAIAGAIAWPFDRGWIALLASTISMVLGFVALSRIRRTGHSGRWAAIIGIAFGVVVYAILVVFVAWDLIDPLRGFTPHD
jgi:predicted PurR-regulated permease PerM